jgi:hypothetical protein
VPRQALNEEGSQAQMMIPQVPVSPLNARCRGKEFPNESDDAGPSVRGSAPGKWSALCHPQMFRRLATGYRLRDIGLPLEGRERRNNGPWSTVSSPVDISSMVRKSQLPASWLFVDSCGKHSPINYRAKSSITASADRRPLSMAPLIDALSR